ncbi:hypothetical protein [Caenimonas aquaedulcis]|uniref:ATP-citrate synthase/succinyl-CoA ligase C-terminal domain-containing protein n=1 Tax=Caenimonas aquaedulcis TaxID=2793270 RepID=A0A931H7E3_9BURK|nr:hypothetical protein [Caenimonas aquaedulcis]MBG9390055.1 hypothetical protein [Caenimonas aquaedulcis]
MKRVVVSRNRYFDSVFLMQAASRMAAQAGMRDASALMATPANKEMLARLGYVGTPDAQFAAAGPNDLVIALDGEQAAVDAIAADPASWLRGGSPAGDATASAPRSIRQAVAVRPDANVAVISVPGAYASREARSALDAGLHAFVFSSNVPVDDELALKTFARERGLLMMGPDCGTAYIGGAGVGFANAVRRGPIGIVGSSGTGLQEFSSLVHRRGSGISHGIGVGSRDLRDEIGGISTFMALDALEADPRTGVIVVIAKRPGARTETRLLERCARSAKPVILCLFSVDLPHTPSLRIVNTIDGAVDLALGPSPAPEALRPRAAAAVATMSPRQRHVRGLFAGGTLCYQAQVIFGAAGLAVASNAPAPGMTLLPDPHESAGTTFVDMGAEVFVEGRPHPMIDSALRRKRLAREAADPCVALILLDFVLGANASRDPVGDMLSAIREAMDAARRRGDALCVAASVCGTDGDAQGLAAQTRALTDAGVEVFSSAAQAAAFSRDVALLLAAKGTKGTKGNRP